MPPRSKICNPAKKFKSQFIEPMPSPGGRCPEGADEGITKLKSLWVSTVVVLPSSVTYGDSFSQEKPIKHPDISECNEKLRRTRCGAVAYTNQRSMETGMMTSPLAVVTSSSSFTPSALRIASAMGSRL